MKQIKMNIQATYKTQKTQESLSDSDFYAERKLILVITKKPPTTQLNLSYLETILDFNYDSINKAL